MWRNNPLQRIIASYKVNLSGQESYKVHKVKVW